MSQLAEKNKINALISGQTLERFSRIETGMLVLRPLISFTDKEIGDMLDDYSG